MTSNPMSPNSKITHLTLFYPVTEEMYADDIDVQLHGAPAIFTKTSYRERPIPTQWFGAIQRCCDANKYSYRYRWVLSDDESVNHLHLIVMTECPEIEATLESRRHKIPTRIYVSFSSAAVCYAVSHELLQHILDDADVQGVSIDFFADDDVPIYTCDLCYVDDYQQWCVREALQPYNLS